MKNILTRMNAWLSLMRFPNLFTVPGDAVFGYLIVNGKTDSLNFIYVIIAVLSYYIFGLVTNDIADYETDKAERPERPLPAGLISVNSAKFTAFISGSAGLMFSGLCGKDAFLAGAVLLLLIYGYNSHFKHVFFTGPASLAVCRMLSLVMGLFAGHSIRLASCVFYPAVVFLLIYIFGLSVSARPETDDNRKKTVLVGGWIIMIFTLFWLVAAFYFSMNLDEISVMDEITPSIWFGVLLGILLVVSTLKALIILQFNFKSSKVPEFIGASIRNIILFQASACAFAGFMNEAFYISLLFMPAVIFSGKYHQS